MPQPIMQCHKCRYPILPICFSPEGVETNTVLMMILLFHIMGIVINAILKNIYKHPKNHFGSNDGRITTEAVQVDHFIYHSCLIYILVLPSLSLFPVLIERPWQGT